MSKNFWKNMLWVIPISLLMWAVILSPLWAATYYLRADGTVTAANKANATSCSAAASAMNITQHNAATFAAGDTITLCDTGGVFRDGVLTPPTSGSAGNVITYNASGTPIINGANIISTWTEASIPAADTYTATLGTDSNSNRYNFKTYIPAGSITTSGTQFRITVVAHSTTGDTINGCSIGEYVSGTIGATPGTWVTQNVQRITWPTGQNSLTMTAGQTYVSDWITYAFDETKNYVFSFFTVTQMFYTQWGAGASGAMFYAPATDTTDLSQATSEAMEGYNNRAYVISKIEVQSPAANVWQATLNTEPAVVAFNGTVGTKAASLGAVTVDKKWFWASNILYQYSTSDPDTRYTSPGTEASIRTFGILGNQKEYITLQDIDVRFNQQSNVKVTGSAGDHNHWIISRLNLLGGGAGQAGLYLNGVDSATVSNVISNYSDGPGLYLYAVTNSTFTDCQGNYAVLPTYAGMGLGIFVTNASHDLTFTRCSTTGNYDQGHGISGTTYNVTLNDCQSNSNGDDGYSTFGSDDGSVTVHDITYNRCYATLNGQLISPAHPEKGDGFTSHRHNYRIHWNYCVSTYNYDSGFAPSNYSSGTIYNCLAAYNGGTHNSQLGRGGFYITIPGVDEDVGETLTMKNCIGFQNDPVELHLIAWSADNTIRDYNVFYHSADTNFATLDNGSTFIPWATYHTTDSYEANSQYADPLFVSTTDFHLQSGSPAINAGTNVSLVTDFDSWTVPYAGGTPDIGAYEYYPTIGGTSHPATIGGVAKASVRSVASKGYYYATPTITWNTQPSAMTYGDSAQALTQATSSNGRPITYSTSTSTYCSVSGAVGSQVLNALNASGNCVVHADIAQDDTRGWLAATQTDSGNVTISGGGATYYFGAVSNTSTGAIWSNTSTDDGGTSGVQIWNAPSTSGFVTTTAGTLAELGAYVHVSSGSVSMVVCLYSNTGVFMACTAPISVTATSDTWATGTSFYDRTSTPISAPSLGASTYYIIDVLFQSGTTPRTDHAAASGGRYTLDTNLDDPLGTYGDGLIWPGRAKVQP